MPRARPALKARNIVLFPAFGTQTKPTSARSFNSSSSAKRSPSYLHVANLGRRVRRRVEFWIAASHRSSGLNQHFKLPDTRQLNSSGASELHLAHAPSQLPPVACGQVPGRQATLRWRFLAASRARRARYPTLPFCGTARVVIRVKPDSEPKDVPAKPFGAVPYRIGHIPLPLLPACPAHVAVVSRELAHECA